MPWVPITPRPVEGMGGSGCHTDWAGAEPPWPWTTQSQGMRSARNPWVPGNPSAQRRIYALKC